MNKEVFIEKRKKFAESLEDNSIAIIFAGNDIMKSEDEEYPFAVNNNFFYLTGIDEHGLILTVSKKNNHVKEILFINDYSERYQLWNGRQLTDVLAKEISGVEEVRYLSTYNRFINDAFSTPLYDTLYLDFSKNFEESGICPAFNLMKDVKARYPYINFKNCYKQICDQRYIKSPEEIGEIKKAISITKAGLERIMSTLKPNTYEYESDAEFTYAIQKRGSSDKAFATIAAMGKNACTMHYGFNDTIIEDGKLVLFDLGAKWKHYCSDITRTFPANGKFTEKQKEIYSIVLEANKRAIAQAKPGMTNRQVDSEIIVPFFAEKLKELGLIKEDSEARKYYPHSVSHPMGLDCHDVGGDPETHACPFVVGSVHTIEPGLYIPEYEIGVRIEDDILITEDGCINLSADIIKEVDDIEKFMAEHK